MSEEREHDQAECQTVIEAKDDKRETAGTLVRSTISKKGSRAPGLEIVDATSAEESVTVSSNTAVGVPDLEHEAEAPAADSWTEGSPVLYVGIGASAGGLEALRDFFDHMSADSDVAFIVVQHLSPDFESLMDELLARNTSMSVNNVLHGVEVKSNTIYLIPPKKNITMVDGCLYLSDQIRQGGVNLPIDHFFRSLAADAKHRAVGIILSGTGSDGSRGIKAIKESGGLILVQDRESSKFDGMPYNAAQTGTADFILPPDELAVYLTTFLKNSMVRGSTSVLRASDNREQSVLSSIFNLLKNNGGIDFSQYKATTVARRIERRMGINQIHSQFDYLSLLQNSKTELESLGRELLINVTSFFRDEHAWDYLTKHIVEPLVEAAEENQELRFWVAGCSTGEEAYSLAITVDEAIRKYERNLQVKIFATDADHSAIAHASTARYREEIVHDVTHERLARYFIKTGLEFEIRSDIRKMVVFASHNMITDPPFSNIDLITCRNVLIYFQHAVQKIVMSSFHFSLRDGAKAFFGSSESVGELKTHYKVLHERFRIYEKITNTRLPMTGVNSKGGGKPRLGMRPVSNLLRNYRSHQASPNRFEHVKDRLINDFVPSCLILNSEHQAMHIYGDANKYLVRFPVGRVTTNIHEIIANELSVALDTALSRSKTELKPVSYSNIQTTISEKPALVDMQVEYFPEKNGEDAYFSVVLIDSQASPAVRKISQNYDFEEETQQRIRDLENELLHKQEHLQVTNEELETTNEELQSANEELMSSNEELQSTNEELQSVNEELYTVNIEHQEKIEALLTVSDDMDNILVATSMGIIFLDDEKLIRQFTAVAAKYFNLLLSDVGRPLNHISNELEYEKLHEDIETVRCTRHSVNREVVTLSGEPVQIKVLPYASSAVASNNSSAVTITITDLTPRLNTYEDNRFQTSRALQTRKAGIMMSAQAKIRVLIVDDSEGDRRIIRRHLEKIGTLTVDAFDAGSVEEAIASLRVNDIDVCLVDYRLGGVETADDLARQIRDYNETLPMILMSGHSRSELEKEIPDKQLMYFLCKADLSPLLLELSLRHAVNSSGRVVAEGFGEPSVSITL